MPWRKAVTFCDSLNFSVFAGAPPVLVSVSQLDLTHRETFRQISWGDPPNESAPALDPCSTPCFQDTKIPCSKKFSGSNSKRARWHGIADSCAMFSFRETAATQDFSEPGGASHVSAVSFVSRDNSRQYLSGNWTAMYITGNLVRASYFLTEISLCSRGLD